MFAPKVAKPQTKAAANSTGKLAPQSSMLAARPFSGGAIEQAHKLQRSIGNQATLRLLSQRGLTLNRNETRNDELETDPASLTAQGTTSRVSWDFSKIPDRVSRSQPPPPLAATPFVGAIQAKLAVGQVNDPLEYEANRVADHVMYMSASPRIQRQCAACSGENAQDDSRLQAKTLPDEDCLSEKEEPPARTDAGAVSQKEPKIQRKSGGDATGVEAAPDSVYEVLGSGGQPLDSGARAFMEPCFGYDFGQVRVHAGTDAARSAAALQAHAYTFGQNVVFATGQYDTGSNSGRRLLAHELAHVVQQGGAALLGDTTELTHVMQQTSEAPLAHGATRLDGAESQRVMSSPSGPGNRATTIRRKIRTDPQATLVSYFSTRGIAFTHDPSINVYSSDKGKAKTFDQEVLIDILASPRLFDVEGGNQAEAEKSLSSHVAARVGIVTFAAQKRYAFGGGSGFRMNPAYYNWDANTGRWSRKPGVDKQEAFDDLNVHPELYAIGCAAATDLTQAGGSKGATFINMPSADESDWIAGESGYVENTMCQGKCSAELLGENLIYTGSGQFWGHFSDRVTYKTLAEWKALVASWNGGSKTDNKRELPTTGLAGT